MVVSSLDPELSPECFTGVASLSPSLTDTVIGLFDFSEGVSGVLLPLALLLLLVTLIVSFAGPSEVSVFVVGFLLLGAGVFSWEEDVFSLKKIAV